MSRPVKRSCCYRDCTVVNTVNQDRTLFQFPKDEERAKRWSELGSVDTSITGPKFMCDLHFSRIYMCFSARRKMLLNTAIPYAYGTTTEGEDSEQLRQQEEQEQQVEMILGDGGPETVGSTSSSQGEIAEHLEGTEYEVLDTEENQMTEIIYMDDLQQYEQEESAQPKTPSKAKILRVEKLPTLVTSSSNTPTIPTLGTPQNIILRKVKIKKRPSSTVTSPVQAKKSKSDPVDPAPVETTTVSSSPAKIVKKVQAVKVTPSPASSSSSSSTTTIEISKPKPAQTQPKPPKTPRSPVKPLRATVMEKRKEVINEFIFKGEEYVQLPKEAYLQDLDDADAELQKYRAKAEEADELLETCRVEQEQCQAENERLEKKVEEYRMIIKNMRDVLGMFEGDGDD